MSVPEKKQATALVVDDDFAVLQLVRANLESAGINVDFAHDGLQALDRVKESLPDIIILDVNMPRLDGWDVLWELRNSRETRHIPIIMLTIESDGKSVTKGWSSGVDCYLPKPFDPQELIMMTRRLLNVVEDTKVGVPTEETPFGET